ncbi:hypothetical protein N7501_001265 [Penicillium viridicatum]|nr:hypothetical protein N7501_001265 [Penicillium viridicatum]
MSKGIGTGSRFLISYLPLRRHEPAAELLYELDAAKTYYVMAISYSAELPAACSGGLAKVRRNLPPSRVTTRILH